MLKRAIVVLAATLLALPVFGQAGTNANQKPVFSLDFSKGVEAKGANGEDIVPKSGGLRIPGGVATPSEDRRSLVYNVENLLNNEQGTIMFWTQGPSLAFMDGKAIKLHCGPLGPFMGCRMSINGKPTPTETRRFLCYPPGSGSWYHFAVTWEKGKTIRLFMNGLPYSASIGVGRETPILDTDVASAKEMSTRISENSKMDRVRIYNRALKTSEVYQEYRSVMPIDLIMAKSSVYADRIGALTLNLAPGGYYMNPNPVPDLPLVQANIKMKSELFNDKKELVFSEENTYKVTEPMDVKLQEVKLPVGKYLLKCTVYYRGQEYMRAFSVTSVMPEVPPKTLGSEQWKRGPLLYSRDFDMIEKMELKSSTTELVKKDIGTYIECAPKCWERMSTEIVFPPQVMGKPCLMEITWPDDKPRMMGLYMFPQKGHAIRDRLGAGIQAGHEFTNSGKMQTTSYLFYPNCENYLFEARSFGMGSPAAVSSIKIYALDETFPALKIHKPENMVNRRIGFYDEDQSYMILLNDEGYKGLEERYPDRNSFALFETMRYFNYTGTASMLFGIYRYQGGYNARESGEPSGMFPFGNGQLDYVMDSFARQDKKFIGYINQIAGDPVLAIADRFDKFDKSMMLMNRFGKIADTWGAPVGNPANPKYQDIYISHYRDMIRKHGSNPALDGLFINLRSWGGLENGYDDWTINLFTKETGIKVPQKDFEERYQYLTGEKRKEWIAWRTQKMTDFYKKFRAFLDEFNPKLNIYTALSFNPKRIEESCVDYRQITAAVHNFHPTIETFPYSGRRAKALGGEPNDSDDLALDFKVRSIKENHGITVGLNAMWETYYETNLNTLYPKKYHGYFQAPNIKPVGRNYLKTLAYSVAMNDSLNINIGGQPLSTFGVEDVNREFSQAYCALPAIPFNTVPGGTDPVTVRSQNTANGTYFYAVNLAPCALTIKVDGLNGVKYTDLSTDGTLNSDEIALLPYQLRSFLIPKEKVELKSVKPVITPENMAFFQKRFDELDAAMKLLEKNGISCAEERKFIEQIKTELAAGHLAEVHRLGYSLLLSNMMDKVPNIANYATQAKMMGKGTYAVNNGSYNFSTFSGKLFFPDQRYRGNNNYGYVLKEDNPMREILGCMRDIENIHGTEYPDLYRTETYGMDGYRFKVPNGTYLVKMYMKVGYKKAFNKGYFHFSVNAQGKPWAKINIHELCKQDVDCAGVFEKEVTVDNGLLELDFLIDPPKPGERESNGTERMLNGIEVIPVSGK